MRINLLMLLTMTSVLAFTFDHRQETTTKLLTEYLKFAQSKYMIGYTFFAVVDNSDHLAKDVATVFFKEATLYPAILGNVDLENNKAETFFKGFTSTKVFFYFMSSTSSFRRAIEFTRPYKWESNEQVHFIICKPMEDHEWMRDIYRIIFRNRIVNFVLVYTVNSRLEVVSGNPFYKQVLNFTEDYKTGPIFPDKIKNLNGYQFKVIMFEDPPRYEYKDGIYYGKDVNILKIAAQKLNATILYMNTYATKNKTSYGNLADFIRNGTADFSFMIHFLVANYLNSTFTYPHAMDDTTIMVERAKPRPQYMNLFLTFDEKIWLSLLICYGVLVIVLYTLRRFDQFQSCMFDVFVVIVTSPMHLLNSNAWSVKIMMIIAINCFHISGRAFQSSLTSVLMIQRHFKDIDSLDEIRDRNITVAIPPVYDRLLPDEMKRQIKFIVTPREKLLEKIKMRDMCCAFALPASYSAPMVEMEKRHGEPIFHVMKERIIPGFAAYLFPSNSPYLKIMERYIRLNMEFGLSSYNVSYNFHEPKVEEENANNDKEDFNIVLTLQHLQSAFYILFIGYLIGSLAFFGEVLKSRYKSIRPTAEFFRKFVKK